MTFTAQQVQDAIEHNPVGTIKYSWSDSTYDIDEEGFYNALDERAVVTLSIDGVEHIVEYVDSYGGMDMGSELWVVFKIGDQLFKKNGWYASHDGSYWDGSVDEVKPVQKTITVFE